MRTKLSILAALLLAPLAAPVFADAWTYEVPGGKEYASPDYEVTATSGGVAQQSFVHYSRGLNEYTRYKWNLQPDETVTYKRRCMVSHSAAIFSFSGTVTVRVTVKKGTQHITLSLTSAKILPSSYNIPCTIENGDTIVFTLNRPEKVVVVPNYDKAWKVFAEKGVGHVPIQTWDADYAKTLAEADAFLVDLGWIKK